MILVGDALACLAAMPSDSVHCVVTSPPYWRLRDYGIEPQVWGGDPLCRHRWGAEGKSGQRLRNGVGSDTAKQAVPVTLHPSTGAFCQRCNAWRGVLGLEPDYRLYVEHMVTVMREVRRVLRPDGTLWLNLGDCYSGGGGFSPTAPSNLAGSKQTTQGSREYKGRRPAPGLKAKDLVGIPWRVAFALQDDGWWLRRDNVWAKRNPMPESCKDRCTSSHEYLFHLTKSARYYYDAEAIKEPGVSDPGDCRRGDGASYSIGSGRADTATHMGVPNGRRNKRSVWSLATAPFPEAHFATFPPALVEPCILAGTSARGVCPSCAAPWRRVVKRSPDQRASKAYTAAGAKGSPRQDGGGEKVRRDAGGSALATAETETIGWRPTCSCNSGGNYADPIPATVLDPFLGAGTTGLVAARLGRDWVGIELSPSYAEIARRRLGLAPQLQKAA